MGCVATRRTRHAGSIFIESTIEIGRTWRVHLVPLGTQPLKVVGPPAVVETGRYYYKLVTVVPNTISDISAAEIVFINDEVLRNQKIAAIAELANIIPGFSAADSFRNGNNGEALYHAAGDALMLASGLAAAGKLAKYASTIYKLNIVYEGGSAAKASVEAAG